MKSNYKITAFGEGVVLLQCESRISLGLLEWLYNVNDVLNTEYRNYVQESVVTYNELAVVYNCYIYSFEEIKEILESSIVKSRTIRLGMELREIQIPVCYDEEFAWDRKKLEIDTGLPFRAIAEKHSSAQYVVYMMGFLPGFLYMGELHEELWCPRLESPRKRVPKGAVGIAGKQTGIYPSESPGGWNLIGKTPIDLIQLKGDRLSPFKPLDRITFAPISKQQFDQFDTADYWDRII